MRRKTFIKNIENLNGGYPVENFSIDRILINSFLYPDLFTKHQIPYTAELLHEKVAGNVYSSKYSTDIICRETFGNRTPLFSSDQYLNLTSEVGILREYSRLAKKWFDSNFYNLSDTAIKNIFKHPTNDKRIFKREHKKIKSQIWHPNEVDSNLTSNSGIFDIKDLYMVRHSQKTDFFSKHIHRLSRIIEPNLEELVNVLSSEPYDKRIVVDSEKYIVSREEIKKDFSKYSELYLEYSKRTLYEILRRGKDITDTLTDPLFREEYIPNLFNREIYLDNFVRSSICDVGRVTVVSSQEVLDLIPQIIEELTNKSELIHIPLKHEDNQLCSDPKNPKSYSKDGSLVYGFRGTFNEGTSCEVRFITPEKMIEATLGDKSHKKKDREDKAYILKKEKLRNSKTLEYKEKFRELRDYYNENYGF